MLNGNSMYFYVFQELFYFYVICFYVIWETTIRMPQLTRKRCIHQVPVIIHREKVSSQLLPFRYDLPKEVLLSLSFHLPILLQTCNSEP